MKFKKDFLKWQQWDKTISNDIEGHSRWSIHYEAVFQHEGKFYRTTYSVGATESQDEQPYEYEEGEIECPEVFPYEVTVTRYEERK